MADPGFPRGGGANSRGEGGNIRFCQNFPKNCMKLKEFGPSGGGGRVSLATPLDPPLVIVTGIKLRSSQNIFIGSKGGGWGALGTRNPFRSNFRFQFHVVVTKIISCHPFRVGIRSLRNPGSTTVKYHGFYRTLFCPYTISKKCEIISFVYRIPGKCI